MGSGGCVEPPLSNLQWPDERGAELAAGGWGVVMRGRGVVVLSHRGMTVG